MTINQYESMTLVQLKEKAKELGVKNISKKKKSDLIEELKTIDNNHNNSNKVIHKNGVVLRERISQKEQINNKDNNTNNDKNDKVERAERNFIMMKVKKNS